MIVKFSSQVEFIGELLKDELEVERRIVRVTFRTVPSKQYPIKYLSLIATAKVGSDIVRLQRFLGELWGAPDDEELQQRADKAIADLKGALEAAGFEVRAGEILEREGVVA